jgi:hypothetical protein
MEELCPQCKELGFVVKVEMYRDQPLERCTVHHWLMNAKARGWELDRYVKASEKYNFECSMPTKDETAVIRASRTHCP